MKTVDIDICIHVFVADFSARLLTRT